MTTSHEPEPSAGSQRLPLRTLLSYGSSTVGLNAMAGMISVHLMKFCTDVVFIPIGVVGTVMMISKFWDAFTDPLIGYASDRTTWRWGRRRPYLLLGSVPAAVLFFLLFSPPAGLAPWLSYLLFGAVFLLFYAAFTVWETPYYALAPELTLDYDERTRLAGYQRAFSTGGDVVGVMAPLVVVALFATPRSGWSWLALMVGLLAVASAVTTYAGTREKPRLVKRSNLTFRQSLKATLRNRPYLILVLTSTCTAISNYTTIIVVLYVIDYYFAAAHLQTYFFGAFFAGVFVSIPLWMRVTKRMGKKSAYLLTMGVYAVILWSIMALGPGHHVAFGVLMVLAGAFNIALWLIPASIVPDIIEWDQLRMGERREGAYYGIWTLVRKGGIAGAYILITQVLQILGYEPGVAQSGRVLLGMKLLLGPIPSVLLLIGLINFIRFPITKHVHHDILRQLAEREGGPETAPPREPE